MAVCRFFVHLVSVGETRWIELVRMGLVSVYERYACIACLAVVCHPSTQYVFRMVHMLPVGHYTVWTWFRA